MVPLARKKVGMAVEKATNINHLNNDDENSGHRVQREERELYVGERGEGRGHFSCLL